MADWLKIKNEYVSGSISYRKLAEKHGVSVNTLTRKAVDGKWTQDREKQHSKITEKIQQKTAELVSTKEANRIGRILSAADMLLEKLEEAATQLDTHIVTNKVKTKTVTYNDGMKPTKEVVVENEIKEVASGPIDRLGLQQVTAALKNIKDAVQAAEGQGNPGRDVEIPKLVEALTNGDEI